jgi:phosphoglycolate phosphatase
MALRERTKPMNIFFDLDGTLLDSKERLYYLFQHLVPECKFSFEEYWKLKRNKIAHKEILKSNFFYSDEAYFNFEKAWLDRIELDEWLKLDKPFEGIDSFLKKLRNRHDLHVVTERQFEHSALKQIEQNGWSGMFETILVTCQKIEKSQLIKAKVKISSEDWLIGDTGKDIQTGKQLGMHTAAVLSGFLNKKKLQEFYPDIIVEQASDLKFY